MTRDQVLARFADERAVFDAKVRAIPAEKLTARVPGFAHSVSEVVVHVGAYEALIVERLRAARRAEATEFDRDREGWEAFNERVWAKAHAVAPADALAEAGEVFGELLDEVAALTDDELAGAVGVSAVLDPAWLDGRTLAELLAIDGYDHYPMHYPLLDAAAGEWGTRPPERRP